MSGWGELYPVLFWIFEFVALTLQSPYYMRIPLLVAAHHSRPSVMTDWRRSTAGDMATSSGLVYEHWVALNVELVKHGSGRTTSSSWSPGAKRRRHNRSL